MSDNPVMRLRTGGRRIAYFLVDWDDYLWVRRHKWFLRPDGRIGRRNGLLKKNVKLHRLINRTPDHLQTDHINGKVRDNRKCNLRSVTQSHNLHRRTVHMGRGAWRYGNEGKWRSTITIDYKQRHLGVFNTKKEAIAAHRKALEEIGHQ